jgi:hypothetical protein
MTPLGKYAVPNPNHRFFAVDLYEGRMHDLRGKAFVTRRAWQYRSADDDGARSPGRSPERRS